MLRDFPKIAALVIIYPFELLLLGTIFALNLALEEVHFLEKKLYNAIDKLTDDLLD